MQRFVFPSSQKKYTFGTPFLPAKIWRKRPPFGQVSDICPQGLDKLGTGLLALVEQFWAQKEYEARWSEAGKLLALMKFYRKHQQDQRFWQAKEAAFKALENSPFRDATHYIDTFELPFEISNMNLPYSTLKKDQWAIIGHAQTFNIS
jgi:hypothetical protein